MFGSLYSQTDQKKFSFGANVGYSSLTMTDINSYINQHFNEAGFEFSEISGCLNVGFQANYHISKRIGFRLGINSFLPNKQSSSRVFYYTDADGSIIGKSELNITLLTRAFDLYFEPIYKFFQSEKYRFLAGAGILYSFGKINIDATDNKLSINQNENWKNSSPGFLLNGEFEYYVKPFLSLFAGMKIQYNLIPNLKDSDGNDVIISPEIIDDEQINLDYSGISLYIGLLVYPFNFKESQ